MCTILAFLGAIGLTEVKRLQTLRKILVVSPYRDSHCDPVSSALISAMHMITALVTWQLQNEDMSRVSENLYSDICYCASSAGMCYCVCSLGIFFGEMFFGHMLLRMSFEHVLLTNAIAHFLLAYAIAHVIWSDA